MSNEDPTKRIDEPAPQPTIETVLERIKQLDEKLSGEIQSLRADMNKGFSQVEEQLLALNAKIEILRPV